MHVFQLFIRAQLPREVIHFHVSRRTDRDILVHRRHFLVPADSHPTPLRENELELHT